MKKLENMIKITKDKMNENGLNLKLFERRALTVVAFFTIVYPISIGYHKLAETHPEYIESSKEIIKYLFK